MTSVAAASWGSTRGFQVQSKRGVAAPAASLGLSIHQVRRSPEGVVPTPAGVPNDRGSTNLSTEGGVGFREGTPKARSQHSLGRGKRRRSGSCDQGLSAFSSEGVAGLCEGLPEGPSPSDPGGGDAAVTLVEQSPSTLVATMRLPTLTIGQRDDSDDAAEYG